MEILEMFVGKVNGILWDYVLIVGLVGIGLYFTVRLGFIQVRRFGTAAKRVFGGVFKKEKSKEGSMSSFQALATSIAAQIGTGNVTVYIIGAIIVMVIFRSNIIPVLRDILVAAFNPEAVVGGAAGIGVHQAVRFGIARGLFSNEAGMGSTPNSHAVADVLHPVEQGLSAMIAVFIDTILVCTATALVILATGAHNLDVVGVGVTQEAFNIAFGPIGEKFLAVCLTFFAFTTVVGGYYFGENNVRFLFKGKNAILIYQIIVLIFIVLGSYQKVGFVWSLADMFNGIMVIPNLIAIFSLFKESKAMLKDYDEQNQKGVRLNYKYEYQNH